MNYDIFKGRWQPLRAAIQQKLDQEAEEKAKREKEQQLEHKLKQREEDERRKRTQNLGDSWASSFQDGSWNSNAAWGKDSSGESSSIPPGPPPPPGDGGGWGGGGSSRGRGASAAGTNSLIFPWSLIILFGCPFWSSHRL